MLDQDLANLVAIPLCHDGLSLTDALPGEAKRDFRELTARAHYSLLLALRPNFDASANDAAAIIAATDTAATLLADWALNCSKAVPPASRCHRLR